MDTCRLARPTGSLFTSHPSPSRNSFCTVPRMTTGKPVDFSARLGEVNAPAYLMAGWYDIFLDWQLQGLPGVAQGGETALFARRPLDPYQFPSTLA